MNKDNINQVGILETLSKIQKYSYSADLMTECNRFIPYTSESMEKVVNRFKIFLKESCKVNVLLLTPEILILDSYKEMNFDIEAGGGGECIICLPTDIPEEMRQSIEKNVPYKARVTFINENEIPSNFNPDDSIIVACGFADYNGHSLVLNSNCRMIDHYRRFPGTKLLLSCGDISADRCPVGWSSVYVGDYFTDVI